MSLQVMSYDFLIPWPENDITAVYGWLEYLGTKLYGFSFPN